VKHLAALRARAARIDADFEKTQIRAEMNLRSIQAQNLRSLAPRLREKALLLEAELLTLRAELLESEALS
jgi:hypothetical protein